MSPVYVVGDSGLHLAGVPASEPHVDVSREWRPGSGRPLAAGDVAGDIQAGEAYDIRFVNQWMADRIITVTLCPVSDHGKYWVQRITEWLICDDPADPAGPEVWSAVLHEDLPGFYRSAARAGSAALREAGAVLADRRHWPCWNGEPSGPGEG